MVTRKDRQRLQQALEQIESRRSRCIGGLSRLAELADKAATDKALRAQWLADYERLIEEVEQEAYLGTLTADVDQAAVHLLNIKD